LKNVIVGGRPSTDRQIHIGESGAPGPLELVLSATGARVTGAVKDDKQQPVSNVAVVLIPEPARRGQADLFRTATSDQYGVFSIRGVPAGEYKLFAWPAELDSWSWRDPSVLVQYEDTGKPFQVDEAGRASIDVQPVVPRR